MLREERFDTGSVALNYAVDSADGPPLVLLHGVMSCWQGWLSAVPSLATRWQLYIPDLRGHGRSGRVPDGYTISDYADDIVTFVREVIGAPAVVVGHSLGAISATAIASSAPELTTAVVLEDPPFGAFRGGSFHDRPEHDYFVAMHELVKQGLGVDELTSIVGARQSSAASITPRAHAMRLARLDPDVLELITTDRALGRYDQSACLRSIAAPTLLLQADPQQGGALDDAEADHAAGLLPRGTLVRLPGVGHGIHSDVPERFARLVHDFLEFR